MDSQTPASPGKVFVAMSGGVDSSVAALLLQRAGHAVIGITFKLFTGDEGEEDDGRACCSLESAHRARRVCDRLGVPHYTLSFVEAFRAHVIERFVAEYAAGRTPNPCVLCNRHLKFEVFLSKALALGADFVATGHHARIMVAPHPRPLSTCGEGCPDGRAASAGGEGSPSAFHLLAGRDRAKDQSYALCHLNQTTMPRVLLPVGELLKGEVRDLAREASLPTAETPESQDICFVREGHYGEFLARHGLTAAPGPIITPGGQVVGEHRGLPRYTVGQRRGLRLGGMARRYFVAEKRLADNVLVVALAEELRRREVRLEDVNWCDGPARAWPESWPDGMRVMLRYRARPVGCRVVVSDAAERTLRLGLLEPQVVAPGQYGVLYDPEDGHVIAGGCIGDA